jgi:predicted nuclease of predicted toxin-antitoxin system
LSLAVILDENIPPPIAGFLRSRRSAWDVRHVRDVGLRGSADSTIFQWAQQHNAIVITFDEDFADTRMYPAGTHAGVIRLRVWPTTIEQIEAALDRLLNSIEDDRLPGSLIIIDGHRIRIRRAAQHG